MLSPLPIRPARGPRLARRMAALAILLILEVTLARFFDRVSSMTLIAVLGFALFFALVGLVAAIVAFRDVWRTEAPGFGAAIFGFLACLLALVPFAGIGLASIIQPAASGLSTDPANPPVTLANREYLPAGFAPLGASVASDRLLAAAYPDILPRSMALSTVETFAGARRAVSDLGWSIYTDEEPADETATGVIRAEARSLIFAIPVDIAIRIAPDGAGSRIDLTSELRIPIRDLGECARLIKSFMQALDDTLARPAG